MKRSMKWLISVALLFVILAGCTGGNDEVEETPKETKVNIEVKMNIGDKLTNNYKPYFFNGFIGEDTLSFEVVEGYKTIKSYQPAKIGHKFKFKELKNIEAEILSFSREEGYVKLHIKTKDN